VFLRVCLVLLSSSYSACWILLLVWLEAIWPYYTRPDGFALTPHSALHTSMIMFKCLRGLPLLYILPTIALVLWYLVVVFNQLWDLLMATLLFRVIELRLGFVIHCSGWPRQLECFTRWFNLPLSLETFAQHLKTHLFGSAYSQQSKPIWVCITFCKVRHGDSVT